MNDPLAYHVARARDREIERIVSRTGCGAWSSGSAAAAGDGAAGGAAPDRSHPGARFLHTR